MTGEPSTGYRTVQHGRDLMRWQHRLFAEIRRAPVYRDLLDEARSKHGPIVARPASFHDPAFWLDAGLDRRSPYYQTLEQAVRELRLTRNGRPCLWAVGFLHDDVESRFDPEKPPRAMSHPVRRVVEISASPASMRVTVRTPGTLTSPPSGMPNPFTGQDVEEPDAAYDAEADAVYLERLALPPLLPEVPMQIGADDWDELERRAVAAARKAIADLKRQYRPATDDLTFHDRRRIKSADESSRELQIERLALHLTGRLGTRNDPRTDRHWFARLGIDPL